MNFKNTHWHHREQDDLWKKKHSFSTLLLIVEISLCALSSTVVLAKWFCTTSKADCLFFPFHSDPFSKHFLTSLSCVFSDWSYLCLISLFWGGFVLINDTFRKVNCLPWFCFAFALSFHIRIAFMAEEFRARKFALTGMVQELAKTEEGITRTQYGIRC